MDMIPKKDNEINQMAIIGPKATATFSVPLLWNEKRTIAITAEMRTITAFDICSSPGIRAEPSTALRIRQESDEGCPLSGLEKGDQDLSENYGTPFTPSAEAHGKEIVLEKDENHQSPDNQGGDAQDGIIRGFEEKEYYGHCVYRACTNVSKYKASCLDKPRKCTSLVRFHHSPMRTKR